MGTIKLDIPCIDITITNDGISEAIKVFHGEINEYLKKFQDKLEKYTSKYNLEMEELKAKNKIDGLFATSNEKIYIQSPLTVLNGPWGSGKTYFLEEYMKYFYKNKRQIIKQIIYIDVSKHVMSNEVNNSLMYEIIKKLIMLNINISKKMWWVMCDAGLDLKKGILKTKINLGITLPGLVAGLEFSPSQFNFSKTKETFNLLFSKKEEENSLVSKLPSDIENTLIILDNLERIQPYSWDVLRVIIKLQEIPNLCFLLPMNIWGLYNGQENNNQYSLDKYINYQYFEFSQGYFSILQTFLLNDDIKKEIEFDLVDILLFDAILAKPIDGKLISIRNVEKYLHVYINDLKEIEKIKQTKILKWKLFFKTFSKNVAVFEKALIECLEKDNLIMELKKKSIYDVIPLSYGSGDFKFIVNGIKRLNKLYDLQINENEESILSFFNSTNYSRKILSLSFNDSNFKSFFINDVTNRIFKKEY